MKNRNLLLNLLAFATLGAATAASAQTVLYKNDRQVAATGLTAVSGGDADLKGYGLFNVPQNKVLIDLSLWQTVYLNGSTVKISVYTLDSNNAYSTTTLDPPAQEELFTGVAIPVPPGKNFTIKMVAVCDQFPPNPFHPATVTYNRTFHVYLPAASKP